MLILHLDYFKNIKKVKIILDFDLKDLNHTHVIYVFFKSHKY